MNFIEIANAAPETATGGHLEEVVDVSAHATEEKPDSLLGTFGINGTLLGFQAFNFLLVFLVVWFLILKPLTSKMAERQKMIDDSIENSKEIEKKLRQGESAFQEKVDMAKVEANRIVEKAKVEADNLSAEIKEKTKRDIEGLVASARMGIRDEKEVMIKEIKERTAEIVVAALEKILEEKIDGQKDKAMIAKSIEQINYDKK